MADCLAKISHTFPSPQIYFDVQHMPKDAKALYYLDKVEMTNFRTRKLKKIKEPLEVLVYCFLCSYFHYALFCLCSDPMGC